MTLLIISCESS